MGKCLLGLDQQGHVCTTNLTLCKKSILWNRTNLMICRMGLVFCNLVERVSNRKQITCRIHLQIVWRLKLLFKVIN